jgi:hypothetical protein
MKDRRSSGERRVFDVTRTPSSALGAARAPDRPEAEQRAVRDVDQASAGAGCGRGGPASTWRSRPRRMLTGEDSGMPTPTSTHSRLIAVDRPATVGDAGREAGSSVEYGIMRMTLGAGPLDSIRKTRAAILRRTTELTGRCGFPPMN